VKHVAFICVIFVVRWFIPARKTSCSPAGVESVNWKPLIVVQMQNNIEFGVGGTNHKGVYWGGNSTCKKFLVRCVIGLIDLLHLTHAFVCRDSSTLQQFGPRGHRLRRIWRGRRRACTYIIGIWNISKSLGIYVTRAWCKWNVIQYSVRLDQIERGRRRRWGACTFILCT